MALPSIYKYIDYRQFLVDTCAAMKKAKPSFSYRDFARLVRSGSPNVLQLIRDRKMGLNQQRIDRLAEAFGLSPREKAYFELIVSFDHARTHDEKDGHFRRIVRARRHATVKNLQKKQYDYLSHWYVPVIRELATSAAYPGDPKWIASRITPTINVSKVSRALKLLESLGLIRESDGRWVQTDTVVSTPSEVISVAVVRYHKDMIELGREAIERFPAAERDIRAVTVGLSRSKYRELKTRMEAVWNEMLVFAGEQDDPEQVYQVNMQLFPLTKSKVGHGR